MCESGKSLLLQGVKGFWGEEEVSFPMLEGTREWIKALSLKEALGNYDGCFQK